MCGLFGFITSEGGGPQLARLKRMAVETEQRGRHAFGLAWVGADGKIQTFKRAGAASRNLADLDRCAGARIVIGHCRYATHGDPADNANNHPHPAGSGWIAHNGVVQNYEDLIKAHGLEPETECDSEVLGLLIARGTGPVAARTVRAVAQTEGNLALLGVWPHRLVVARRGNPMHFADTAAGFYFGSLPGQLPGKACEVKDDSVFVLTLRRGVLHLEGHRIAAL